MYLPAKCCGVVQHLPIDSGCTITMISGRQHNHVQRSRPEAKFLPFEKKIPITNVEEGNCLYAIGIGEAPWGLTGEDGREVENWYDALVVPGIAWDGLFGENHLEDLDVVTYHRERIVEFRAPGFGGARRSLIGRPRLRSSLEQNGLALTLLLLRDRSSLP